MGNQATGTIKACKVNSLRGSAQPALIIEQLNNVKLTYGDLDHLLRLN